MKNKLKIDRYSLHKFNNRDNINFSVNDYSCLKYGSGSVAEKFGIELAIGFFNEHAPSIAAKQVVVMESAFASIKNAASLVTNAFTIKLNQLLVEFNGTHIERTKINRLVPYITDYGKLSLKKRMQLLKKDTFTLDHDFCKNKFLLFIDDIFITGTHQKKIEEMMMSYGLDMDNAMCIYYAELTNHLEDPSIESFLNNFKISNIESLQELIEKDSNYKIVVRTVKTILQEENDKKLELFLSKIPNLTFTKIYNQCLSEGYYKNPAFSKNFSIMRTHYLNNVA